MAKKYLLYIHDELFDKETSKSQLVNNLLERHYHDTVEGGKSQADVLADIKIAQSIIKTPKDVQTLLVTNKKGQIVTRIGEQPDGTMGIQRDSRGICKIHATPLDSRGKCLQKSCKYGK